MERLREILKLSIAYIITIVLLVVTLVVLKCIGLTTLGTLGIIALIITITPGFTIIRKHVKPIKYKNQLIDFWFLSGVAVALVALVASIADDQANINDRWGYGIVGGIVLILMIVSVVKSRK
ncbi:TPA: hypothetical protein QCJ52_000803 [Enterobacter ludwigii]|uniref:hypothetical protein n=1 Tax=Enterobacter ludwigii TaxID=299767 RepID=UPI002FD21112|nr:hypothetical protein [Enterobacter ludwigii]